MYYNVLPVNEILQMLAGSSTRNTHYCKCISYWSTQHRENTMQQFCLPISSDRKEDCKDLNWFILFLVGTVKRSFQLFPGEINEDSAIDSNAAAILVAVSAPFLKGFREVIKK